MRRRISEMVIVVTGASSGIGRATALKLARRGGTVVLASRQEDVLHEVARECERHGAKTLPVRTDVTNEQEVQALAKRAVEAFGRIDAWVNDAGVTVLGRFEEIPPDDFRRVIETNFFGYVYGARAVLPYFRSQGHGVLVNVSSVLGKVGVPLATPYVASKFAITGFSESLRMELLDHPGIHVSTVFPATIDTPFFQHAANYTGRTVQAPTRAIAPEDVADAIVRCIVAPRREVTVGAVAPLVAMRAMAPMLTERLITAKIKRSHFQERPSPVSQGNLFQPATDLSDVHGGWRQEPSNGQISAGKLGMFALLAAAGFLVVQTARKRQAQRPRRRRRHGEQELAEHVLT